MKVAADKPAVDLAVGYARVSTKEQVEGQSLASQQKAITAYCQQHGWTMVELFIEEGESATTINRTQFQAALEFVRQRKGGIGYFVVKDLSRFARDKGDHFAVRSLLSKWGCALRSTTEPIDDSPEGKLMEGIFASTHQYENDLRRKRTKDCMIGTVEAGRWPFRVPLGYRRIGSKKQSKVVPDADRAPLIAKAFELFSEGVHRKEDVVKIVNGMGLRTLAGKPLPAQTFDRMLRDPFYAGWLRVPKWGADSLFKGEHEAIVSQATFDRVQEILTGKRVSVTPRQRSNPDFPLRGFIRCGSCGRPVTASRPRGRNGTQYPTYHCQHRDCAHKLSVRKEKLEADFVAYLERLQPKTEYIRLFKEVVLDVWNRKQANARDVLTATQKRLTALREQKEKLVKAMLDGRFQNDEQTYDEMMDKTRQEIVIAEMEHRDARLEELDVEAVLNFAAFVFTNAARLWTRMSHAQRQRFQQVLFPAGVQYSDGNYRTSVTSLLFNWVEQETGEETQMVALPGIEPGF